MSYPARTGTVLLFLGYELDIDFECDWNGASVDVSWYSADPQPTEQDIIDNELAAFKAAKIKQLKAEADRRMRLINPTASFDNTVLLRGLYLSVEPTARGAFASNIQQLVNIWTPGSTAAVAINALVDIVSVEAYDVVNTPSWP